ncbi:MAG: iron-containing alcohol dehydrogenase [bacterium]
MKFEFQTVSRVIFGSGSFAQLANLAASLGKRALVVQGRSTRHKAAGIPLSIDGEPTFNVVREGAQLALEKQCDLVIGIGGGSVLDAAKAIAMLMTNGGDPLDYAEVIGRGKPVAQPSAPFIAVPTTAGTGSEATRNAVLGSPEHKVKVSLRSPLMLPRVAVVDPELAIGLPPAITASTGMDALSQLIEPFVSSRANPMTDALCRNGIRRAARSLVPVFENGANLIAREDMALASLFSGMALANAGLGAVHGFAASIGGMFSAPHGAVCAALLAPVMDINVRALRARDAGSPALNRYEELARVLTDKPAARIEDSIAWTRDLAKRLGIPPLRAYGIAEEDLPELAERADAASSMKGNPIALKIEERKEILAKAL